MSEPLFEIIVAQGGIEISRHALGIGEFTIGRASASSVPIKVGPVSRQHARVLVGAGGEVKIEDLASANGTLLDEQPLGGLTPWPTASLVVIGDITLALRPIGEEFTPTLGTSQAHAFTPPTPAPIVALDSVQPGEDERTVIQRHLPLTDGKRQRLDVEKELARGGMGAVLSARESATRRTVAMKIMLRGDDAKSTLRFIEEAQVTAQLEHPNIVPVHDLGIDAQGQPFYTMKLVAGIDLKKVLDLLKRRIPESVAKYPLGALLTLFQKVCDALAFAHSRGVIHRDLKPANIMLGKFGEVLVMDWGLAKIIGGAARHADADSIEVTITGARREEHESFGTMDGSVMGTPHYMSPEQARGEVDTLDARSDVFALGIILYELLTLERPFTGKTAAEIMEKVIAGETPAPAQRVRQMPKAERPAHLPGGEIPASLDAILRKALAPDRTARYPSVPALQADLLAYQTGFATSAENAGAWKQITLLIRRHRAVATSIAAALVILTSVVSVAFVRITGEKNRAERALTDLHDTAPAIARQAALLVERRDFAEALVAIQAAAGIAPEESAHHLQRAHILQSLRRFDEAAAAYDVAARDTRHRETAQRQRQLSLAFAQEQRSAGKLSPDTIVRWHTGLLTAGRVAEATALMPELAGNAKQMRETVEAVLARAGWKTVNPIKQDSAGLCRFNLRGAEVTDLSPLASLPIGWLNLNDTGVRDFSVLRTMPIESLSVSESNVADFTTLRDTPIDQLVISSCPVKDLEFLAGLKLRELEVTGAGSSPKTGNALRGMPLEIVKIMQGWFDLSVLADSPITDLDINQWQFGSLKGIERLRLRRLSMSDSKIKDLAPLAGMPLELLDAHGTNVTDISPIAKAPLKELYINDCKAPIDVGVLRECRTLESIMLDPHHRNIETLRTLPNLQHISYEWDYGAKRPKHTAAEFWAAYDAKQAAGAK